MENNSKQPIGQSVDQQAPIQQQSAQQPIGEMPKPKSRFKLISLIIFLLLTIGVGVYLLIVKQNVFLSQNQQKPTPIITQPPSDPIPTPDLTANWKTYTNTKYGYQLKVPGDFYNQAKPSAWVNTSDSDFMSFNKDRQWYFVVNYAVNGPAYNPPANTDLIVWLKEKFTQLDIPDKANYEIDGVPAVKIHYLGRPQAFNTDYYYFMRNGKLFEIQVLADVDDEGGSTLNEVEEITVQILSTFKFTD